MQIVSVSRKNVVYTIQIKMLTFNLFASEMSKVNTLNPLQCNRENKPLRPIDLISFATGSFVLHNHNNYATDEFSSC